MKAVLVTKPVWDKEFKHTLNILELASLKSGTIDVNLNSQIEVTNFISGLHRRFHYEVCMLKERLEKA